MKPLVPLALGLLLAAPALAVAQETVAFSGRLVDADGIPVAAAQVAESWVFSEDPVPAPTSPLTADEQGLFAGELEVYRFPVVLTAYGPDGDRAGWIEVESADETSDLLVIMEPTVRVRGTVTRSALETPLPQASVFWFVDGKARLDARPVGDEAFEVALPRGLIQWTIYDDWFSMLNGQHAVEPDEVVVELGDLDVPAAFLAKHQGKELPEWTVSDARGVALEDATLAAHRGKWLLIEFWGHW